MTTVKYDIGDILTWCDDDDCYATAVIVRWHTKDVSVDGISLKRYTEYDLFLKSKEKDNFELAHGVPEYAFSHYKVVGHIDISGMPEETVKNNLIYATAYELCEERIPYAILTHWNIIKTNEKNCCYNLADKLAEECKQKQKHLDLANNKILELKKEVDSLRQTLRDDSIRIRKNLSVMGFTEDAICSIMYSELNDI